MENSIKYAIFFKKFFFLNLFVRKRKLKKLIINLELLINQQLPQQQLLQQQVMKKIQQKTKKNRKKRNEKLPKNHKINVRMLPQITKITQLFLEKLAKNPLENYRNDEERERARLIKTGKITPFDQLLGLDKSISHTPMPAAKPVSKTVVAKQPEKKK